MNLNNKILSCIKLLFFNCGIFIYILFIFIYLFVLYLFRVFYLHEIDESNEDTIHLLDVHIELITYSFRYTYIVFKITNHTHTHLIFINKNPIKNMKKTDHMALLNDIIHINHTYL